MALDTQDYNNNSEIRRLLGMKGTKRLEISNNLTEHILNYNYSENTSGVSLKFLETRKRSEELGDWDSYYILFSALKYNDCSELYLAMYSGNTITKLNSYKAQILIPDEIMPSTYYTYTFGTANSYQIISSSEGFTDGTQSVKTTQQTAAIRFYDDSTGEVYTENITIPVGDVTITGSEESVAQDKTKNIAEGTQITENNINQYVTVSGLTVVGRTPATVVATDYDILLPYGPVTLAKEGSNVPIVLTYDSYGTTIRKTVSVPFEVVSTN